MVQRIVNSEARRNDRDEIIVYHLREDDGGGKYEVAGINERFHLPELKRLASLIKAGRHLEAERGAHAYIARKTDFATSISQNVGLQYNHRDCAWNRGPTGAATILQLALGVDADGVIGPITRRALRRAEQDVPALLQSCRKAREKYERMRGRHEATSYWKGLSARWDRVLAEAIAYHEDNWTPIKVP